MRPRRPIPQMSTASEAALAEDSQSPSSAPKRKAKKSSAKKLRPGQPGPYSKLDDEIEGKICALIANGLRYEDAARLCGLNRDTLYNWRVWGEEQPESRFGRFLEKVEQAILLSKGRMVKKLIDDPDWRGVWKLMQNRWPEEFRESFRFQQEISGPGGEPLAIAANPFQVSITLQQEPGVPAPEWTFREHIGNGGNGDGRP